MVVTILFAVCYLLLRSKNEGVISCCVQKTKKLSLVALKKARSHLLESLSNSYICHKGHIYLQTYNTSELAIPSR